jgi:multidrug efflux pump subunit AcrB
MISLFGMILVIGILVDDGIVIAENIYTHFENGKSPRKAALDGTLEVMPAVLTSVTTTIVVFSALFFIKGRMEFMYEMAFVVVFSLAFSLLEALFVLPAHMGSNWVLRKNPRQNTGKKIRDFLDRILNFIRVKLYGRSLKFVIKWRYVAIFTPIFMIMITAGLFKGELIKATFFPAIPFDQFNVDLAFKPGSGEAQTLESLKQIDNFIWEVNDELKRELNDTVDFVNYSFVSTGSAFNGKERGSHAGNIFVLLRDLEKSGTSSFEIVTRVQKKVGNMPEAEKLTIQGRATFGTPISVSLLGKDEKMLDHAKEDLIQSLKQIEDLNNIADVNPAGMREVRLKLKPMAYFLGFSQASLTNQIRQGFFGGQAQRLQHGKDELRVWVRYPKSDRINLGQMEAMRIKTPMGEFPLSELATYTIDRGPVSIKHYNSAREIRIDANVVSYDTPIVPIQEKIENEIMPELLALYPGLDVVYLGQKKDSEETMQQIQKFFLPAFLLMFLIIIIHFKSMGQGMIIIAMIPLAWLGAIWGHGIESVPVSLLSVWGMLALSGVIINDAVVFLSKYNSLLVEGRTVEEAVYETGIARFRAIVLTTITTSVGLYPIIFERSFQAQFLVPMAVALAYGVLVGTGFILIFFPVIILALNDAKRYSRYVYNRINLWILHGDPKRKVPPKIAASLMQVPSRESVEIAIKHSKRTID